MPSRVPSYRGRFAPSPTGPLHFGSLVAALGSWVQARSRGGEWLVRMEDIDPPREVEGAADEILRLLDLYGLHWDGEVLYQSRRGDAYQEALETLRAGGALYPCGCSRSEVAARSAPGPYGPIYPGTCREGISGGRRQPALRVVSADEEVTFEDGVQGRCGQHLRREVGDFVVRRADGLFAYQLAVVVDDAWQGITEVVRGADLLDSTPRQIQLQRLLGVATPAYAHLPVARNRRGEKLSKQTHAAPLPEAQPVTMLSRAWAFLGQPRPPFAEAEVGAEEFLAWAADNWRLDRVPRHAAAEST